MKVTHYRIPARVTLNIAVCADFHSSTRVFTREKRVPALLEQLRALSPDLIVFPGDTLNNTAKYGLNECFNQAGTALLTGCTSVAPVFCSIGNHEFGMSPENRKELESRGVHVLDNETVCWNGFCIGGLTSAYQKVKFEYDTPPVPDTQVLNRFPPDGRYRILLCHHPEYWPRYVVGHGVDLTIAGHAHGGQWRLFGRGIFAPGQGFLPKYTSGIHTASTGEKLVISRGMTNTAKIPRFFNPQELLMLHLYEISDPESI